MKWIVTDTKKTAELLLAGARILLETSGKLVPVAHLFYPDGGVDIIGLLWHNDMEKTVMVRALQAKADTANAILIIIFDSWKVEGGTPAEINEMDKTGLQNHPRRTEALSLQLYVAGKVHVCWQDYKREGVKIVWAEPIWEAPKSLKSSRFDLSQQNQQPS